MEAIGSMSKDIVFLVCFEQPNRGKSYKYSVRSWQDWSKHNGASVVILDNPIVPIDKIRPNWQKYFILDLLQKESVEFDHILIADADTVVHPDCPNLFDIAGDKYSAVLNYGSLAWVYHSIELYNRMAFQECGIQLHHYDYVNTGIQIFHYTHKDFIKGILQFVQDNYDILSGMQLKYKLGTEQTPVNYLRKLYGVELNVLDYKFNMQDLCRKEILGDDMLFTKLGWVYHFNAIPQGMGTADYWVEKTYKYLYGGGQNS